MIEHKNIEIHQVYNTYRTSGLNKVIGKELEIPIRQRSRDEYISVLTYLIDYFLSKVPEIHPEQTISYYSWILKFVETTAESYSLWEAECSGNGYTEGVDYAVKTLEDQLNECRKHDAPPAFPLFSQNIVISRGVYEGLPIDGMRYPSPGHMTGWWLITDMYDNRIDSLMNVHYFHIAFERPDILKYLSLPDGFRFRTVGQNSSVWFDKTLLEQNE